MANPILNDKSFEAAAKRDGATWVPPIDDGPISRWPPVDADRLDRMTVGGTAQATAVLFALLLVAAGFGWAAVDRPVEGEPATFPAIALLGVAVGFVTVLVSVFKPNLARFLGPVYALAQGYFVGAVSRAYELEFDGIVLAAVGVTIAVFAVMLFLYGARIIRVTDRMRRIVIGATVGVMLFYVTSFVVNLFTDVSFLRSSSLLSIGFSLAVAGLAAFNLALDFDFIERGSAAGLPKNMEWLAALGLLVTIIWLYLEILRLLAKLRDR